MDRLHANKLAEEFLRTKMLGIQSLLDDLKDGIASDSKSTAGDKHETARAMAQLEQEQLSTQIQQLQEHLQMIQQAKRVRLEEKIAFGSLVRTSRGWFYLSSGIGAIAGEEPFFCLSTHTPMGQALMGKSKGEQFVLNGQTIEILEHA